MRLREFLNTCGNEWTFIKVWIGEGHEPDDFDKGSPDFIYSNVRAIPDSRLNDTIDCWYFENDTIYILL